jgi:hypothetical protein
MLMIVFHGILLKFFGGVSCSEDVEIDLWAVVKKWKKV